jgi:integrase
VLSTTTTDRLPYVVLRGASGVAYYKRQIPMALRPTIGRATFTVKLQGHPAGSPRDRARFAASYARADAQSEDALTAARAGQRQLTPQKQLGVAGAWAQGAGPQDPDPVDRSEIAAILSAVTAAGIVLPSPIASDWAPGPIADERALVDAAQRLARSLHLLDHPGAVEPPDGGALWGGELQTPAAAAAFLVDAVSQARAGLEHWIAEARQQLHRLGVTVDAAQRQTVALRLATTSAALGEQVRQIEHGGFPAPLTFPDPPPPSAAPQTLTAAFERWVTVRSPAAKTRTDAERRLEEFRDFIGTNALEHLTPQQVIDWRGHLLQGRSTTTAKKHLGLVRAVLQAASDDGLPVPQDVLDRMGGRSIRNSSGTRQQRRPFTLAEATLLIQVSRQQQGRHLDRWGLPLGLALGARLEEIAGIRKDDITQVDGIHVVNIRPSTERRLKNDSSCRQIPIPQALQLESFLEWVEDQPDGLLFPEPQPPATDPRLSHYASIRLGKIIRRQAGILDPQAVFHSARHFTAQQLVDAGAEQRMVEQILGHGSKSMTARYSRAGVPIPQVAAAMEGRDWGWWPER